MEIDVHFSATKRAEPQLNLGFSNLVLETDDWATPQTVFDELNAEFSFTLDVAASKENHKCDRYYDVTDDGLQKSWDKERVWCNPPYGRKIGKWVEKAATGGASIVVALLPARTDTLWWHNWIQNKAEVRFIKGRLKFGGHKNSAPFPSAIVIFRS